MFYSVFNVVLLAFCIDVTRVFLVLLVFRASFTGSLLLKFSSAFRRTLEKAGQHLHRDDQGFGGQTVAPHRLQLQIYDHQVKNASLSFPFHDRGRLILPFYGATMYMAIELAHFPILPTVNAGLVAT